MKLVLQSVMQSHQPGTIQTKRHLVTLDRGRETEAMTVTVRMTQMMVMEELDYQEMAAKGSGKETSHQPEVDFTPSPIAAGLLSITHQLIMQNRNLINFQDHFDWVIEKLDAVLQSQKTTPMSQDIKGLFKMYNENMVAQHRVSVSVIKV